MIQRKQFILIAIGVVMFIGGLYAIQAVILGGAPAATPTETTLSGQVSKSLAPPSGAGTQPADTAMPKAGEDFTIKSTEYFANDTWAVVYVEPVEQSAGDPAYLVMRKQGNAYQTVLGPGTYFSTDVIAAAQLPQEVINYLRSLDLVGS